jgi:hypothetical protein
MRRRFAAVPVLWCAAGRNRVDLAKADPPQERDAGIGAAETFVLAIGNRTLTA